MDLKSRIRNITRILISACIVINGIFILLPVFEIPAAIDTTVVLIGNFILFLLALFTFIRSAKALDNPNPHAFVRSYYAGFLIRLLVIAGAAFIYIYMNNGIVNKPALFICMGIYAVYSVIEVSALRKILNEKKNA